MLGADAGVEPALHGLWGQRLNRLSYLPDCDGRPEGILTLTLCTGEVRCCSSSLPSVYMISMKTMIAEMAIMVPKAGVEPAPSALNGGAPPVVLYRRIARKPGGGISYEQCQHWPTSPLLPVLS